MKSPMEAATGDKAAAANAGGPQASKRGVDFSSPFLKIAEVFTSAFSNGKLVAGDWAALRDAAAATDGRAPGAQWRRRPPGGGGLSPIFCKEETRGRFSLCLCFWLWTQTGSDLDPGLAQTQIQTGRPGLAVNRWSLTSQRSTI
ncbi:UNVERIFIED_CONTAM: hypothetical protein Slati_0216600 [Sesamum latifolium]|uniref:Uncharacterized protein n=1 Tax=Sesamum latifolium TaxID=2727402 RepID=A0AAW2YCR7_9LAMI